MSLRLKKGDSVIVLKGKDRGKRSKIMRFVWKNERAVVEGVNLMKKHQRSKRAGEKGQVVTVAAPIHVSDLALYCSRCGRGVRFGVKTAGDRKSRVCRRCGAEL